MKKSTFSSGEIEDLKRQGYTEYQIKGFEHFERIELSLEDWINPEAPEGAFRLLNSYEVAVNEVQKIIFVLPEIERQKIERHKSKIVEGFVENYTDVLISRFERQFSTSKEIELLITGELKKLDNLLFQWKEPFTYVSLKNSLLLRFQTYGDKKWGSMCDWYERFCIRGENAENAVSRHHSWQTANELNNLHPDYLHFVVGALAFNRYKSFLESRLKVVTAPSVGVQLIPAFVGLFVGEEAAHKALNAAMIAGIIDETGESKLGKDRKIKPVIVQFWEAVSDRKFELTHIRATKDDIGETYLQQCQAIAEQFGAKISPKTVYSRAGERAGKFFSAVFAELERQQREFRENT